MGNLKAQDERFLRLAIAEAVKGRGHTAPNPAVGAVIVKGGKILGAGWHKKAGAPHAEIEALRSLKSHGAARGATIYITLEPCSTHGKTPPCTEAIVQAGIVRVVYGATDPNPRHAGRARHLLEKSKISVTPGILEKDCAAINEAWNVWIAKKRPLVIAKAGMSLDGRITSPPGQRWITSKESRADAMQLRSTCDAILVGGETVRVDNPKLTVRGIPGARQPLRAVWTRSGTLPPEAHLFTDRHKNRTRIFQGVSLREALRQLAQEGVQSVLIEGGGRTLGEAFDRKVVDRVVFYVAPVIFGGGTPAVGGRGAASPELGGMLEEVDYRCVGPDIRISGRVRPAGPTSKADVPTPAKKSRRVAGSPGKNHK
ncbi:MAG: bifunctional diaminohydroxyphosphoribosylaminopyrimidine deaminase/5-amino-6-(5-phosphoribosylamino)uracil reductase RibD [Terrimicrobiaceae bacterium]